MSSLPRLRHSVASGRALVASRPGGADAAGRSWMEQLARAGASYLEVSELVLAVRRDGAGPVVISSGAEPRTSLHLARSMALLGESPSAAPFEERVLALGNGPRRLLCRRHAGIEVILVLPDGRSLGGTRHGRASGFLRLVVGMLAGEEERGHGAPPDDAAATPEGASGRPARHGAENAETALPARSTGVEDRVPSSRLVENLLGSSEAIREVRRLVSLLGPAEVEVVIRGESGTGKELVARSLHGCSRRSSGPLVAVNCAEIGENLATSELFGHQKGAFTGAVREHGGLVESAHGGTLFLDEIGEIDPAIQAKLLRFLERGEARAVGEARSRKVNVRLISATHAPLETRMEEGTFRSDLFYRLAGAEIHLPPLRERGDDLEILTRHFVRAEGPDRSERPWSARAWSIWRAYAWPGNVRELRHEVRRLLALHPTESRIEPHHLSPRLHRPAHSAGSPPARPVGTLRSVLREVERKQVALALDAAGGNVSRAARMLGLTRQGLSKKLNALDLRSP